MNKISTLASLIMLFACTLLHAQNRQISGHITDVQTGEPVPGATIFAKEDSTIGTASDALGNFTLDIPPSAKTLVVRSLGYNAQEVPLGTETTLSIKLGISNKDLAAVVISASRKEEKVLDAPASVSVISEAQLQKIVAISPTANLKAIPGVDIMSTGLVQSNVVVRGFNNIFSGALLTMVDNRYATVPSLRVNVNMFIPTDNTDLERVEVLRGPASALYGPDCANGVLHLITRSPLDQEKKYSTTASIGFGFRGKIGDTIPIANPVDPTTGSVYADYTPEFDFPSLGDRLMYSASLRHAGKISDHFGYRILFTYFKGVDWKYDDPFEPAMVQLGRETAEGRVSEGDSMLNSRNYDISKIGLDLRLDYRFKNSGQLIFSSGLTDNDDIEMTGIGAGQAIGWKYYYAQLRFSNRNFFSQVFLNGSNAGQTYLLRTGDLIIDHSKLVAGQVQRSNMLAKDRLELVYGFDGIATFPNTEGTINGRNENSDNIYQFGAYVQGDYHFNPEWELIGAFRYDYHNFVTQPFFSPRAAVLYKPNPKNAFRITYNRAFSSPTSNNLNLDILQLADLGDLGIFAQGLFGLDYLPSIGARAVGNRDGFTFSYDDQGLPQFHSPYSQYIGNAPDQYYSLSTNDQLNNAAWDVAVHLLIQGFSQASGLSEASISSLVYLFVPVDITHVDNSLKLLNLTTASFDDVSPNSVIDYGKIKNSASNTVEGGWKGALFDNHLFITTDFYMNNTKDFVGPLTNITPNVFLDQAALTAYLTPIITANWNDPSHALQAGVLTGLLDPVSAGGNGNGTGLDEFLGLVIGAGTGVPVGTVVPTQYNNSDIFVTYANIGDVTVFGTDLGVNIYVNDRLQFMISYSWVNKDSVPVEGAQLGYVALNAPKNKVAVKGNYTIKKLDLDAGLIFRWAEAYPANSGAYTGRVDATNDLDLTLNYTPHYMKNTDFALLITNLYNREQQYFVGAPVIGRMVFFKVTRSF